jgi:hypothetical protein
MASRLNVGTEVKRGTKRMKIVGLGDIDGREHAWCEWIDADGLRHSQQYPIGDLELAVDHGPSGGPWGSARKKGQSGEN